MTQLFAFDKDGTITPPNSPLSKESAYFFVNFLKQHNVSILTARDIKTCQEHIIDPIIQENPSMDLTKITLACSNGSEIFAFQKNEYKKVSTDVNALRLKDGSRFNIKKSCDKALEITKKIFPRATIEIRWDFFIAIPCIPRDVSTDERNLLDPDAIKRWKIITQLKAIFPDFFEILPGGKTTIDIALINKEYGMRHVMEYFNIKNPDQIHYFGDSFNGGNDEPVKNIKGIHIHEVKSPDETFEILKNL